MLPEWLDGPLRAVLEDLQHGAWGEARPACPGHPHPAAPSPELGWVPKFDRLWTSIKPVIANAYPAP